MKLIKRKRDPIDVNLTPLIDVVFLLLIFFMVSTTWEAAITASPANTIIEISSKTCGLTKHLAPS